MQTLINTSSNSPPPSQLKYELAKALKIKEDRLRNNQLSQYRPYSKQADFHRAGAEFNERLFMAGNQLGKTVAGGAEWAIHLTGRYPDWWDGAVFDRPVRFWASGVTGESTRDNPQRLLIGEPANREKWGQGMIPKECFVNEPTPARGIPNSIDSIVVRHGGGADVQAGFSELYFKSYEKGREKWQGPTLDGVWFDEEPPPDIYSEGRTRTQNGQRYTFTIITFTPLLGMSEVVRLFLHDETRNENDHP